VKRPEVRALIYQRLDRLISTHGFRLKKSEEGFVRKIPGGRQVIGVPLWDYHPEFEFSLNVCIRLDEAEHVLHLCLQTPPEYQSASYTIMMRLEYFMPGQQTTFIFTSERDISDAVDKLSPVLQKEIIPFLDKHQDLKAVAATVNHSEKPVDISVPPYAGIHRIILAHLTKDPAFEQLVVKYRKEMGAIVASEREKFEKVVEHLRSRS
jgi:hypothetical protein